MTCGIPVVKQTFVCRVVIPLIFKNVRRRKKIYDKYKSEKIPEADSAPVTDLKMELLAKIVNDLKL